MKQERLKILSMLEDGKISAEEAARLLEALKRGGIPVYDEDYEWEMEDRVNRFARNVEGFSKDVKYRMESAYKDMEPRLQKATRSVLEKTAAVIDDISRSLNESIQSMKKNECCCDEEAETETAETETVDEDKPIEN